MNSQKLIFLSCDEVTSHIGEDLLSAPFLPDFDIEEIDWKKFEPNPKVQAGVVIRTTWNYHRSLPEFLNLLEKIEASGVKLMNPASLVRWNSNKIYLKELSERGVAIPESYFFKLESIDQLQKHVTLNKDWILKPQVSLSAHNTFWIHASQLEAELAAAFEALKGSDVILQEFCPEILNPGEISLIYFNGEFSHAAMKTPKAGDFRVQAEYGGYIRRFEADLEHLKMAESVLAQASHKWLYARVDMIPRPHGLELMELEMIEPSLYLATKAQAPKNLARAIQTWLA